MHSEAARQVLLIVIRRRWPQPDGHADDGVACTGLRASLPCSPKLHQAPALGSSIAIAGCQASGHSCCDASTWK